MAEAAVVVLEVMAVDLVGHVGDIRWIPPAAGGNCMDSAVSR